MQRLEEFRRSNTSEQQEGTVKLNTGWSSVLCLQGPHCAF